MGHFSRESGRYVYQNRCCVLHLCIFIWKHPHLPPFFLHRICMINTCLVMMFEGFFCPISALHICETFPDISTRIVSGGVGWSYISVYWWLSLCHSMSAELLMYLILDCLMFLIYYQKLFAGWFAFVPNRTTGGLIKGLLNALL